MFGDLPMAQKRVTFNDIARYTGFSKTTVSRFFNRPETLTKEHRQTIQNALDTLGYRQNKMGRNLARGSTECVGIIMPNSYNYYYMEMLSQVLSTFDTFGYKFMAFTSDGKKDNETRFIQELLAYQVEGLLVFSHTLPSRYLADLPIPVVSVEREDEFISSVNCDNYMGALQAASLLAKHKCDILFHVNNPVAKNIPAYQRITGFRDFCEEQHLRYEILIKNMGNRDATMNVQLSSLFQTLEAVYPNERKGIFFSTDTAANTFLKLLIRKYHTLPDTYRLVGFDGSFLGSQAIYSISSIGQQIDKISHEALSLLFDQIRSFRQTGIKPEPVHKVITPILLRRETTELYD